VCDAKRKPVLFFLASSADYVGMSCFLSTEKDFQCLPKKCRRAGTCEGIVVRLEESFRTEISV